MPDVSAVNDWKFSESYVQYAPTAAYAVLDLTPVAAASDFWDRSSELVVANVFNWGITQILKRAVHEQRPDGTAFNSFPSGHTATAFVGAELLRHQYGWGAGAAGYACGIYTGAMRAVHERHWWWDTVGGAVLGIGSAHIAIALQPVIRKHIIDPVLGWLFKEEPHWSLCVAPMPSGGGAQFQYCLTF